MKDWPWPRFVVLGVIILVVFFFGFFKPKYAELKKTKESRVKVEQEVQNLRAKKRVLDKIEAEIKVLNVTLKELEAIIPQKRETSDILGQIHRLATNSHLNIEKFINKGETAKEYFYEWQISVDITGSYHNLATFFDRLSRFSRLFTIENFSIKSIPNQTEASTISATWITKTYIFREEVPVPEAKGKKVAKKA
jgi:Tfp pilus assembly protein PilO